MGTEQTNWTRAAMRSRIGQIVLMGFVALAAGVEAAAQQLVAPDGRLYDNPQLGPYGQNAPRPVEQPVGADLIITGNVTGGRAFRGYSPIGSSTAFGLGSISVPSSALSNFRRDSVGVGDFAAGSPWVGPQPYYSPSNTVLNTGQIVRGFNQPGSSIPLTAYQPLSQRLDEMPQALGYPSPIGQVPAAMPGDSRLELSPQQFVGGSQYVNPLTVPSSLFGPQRRIDRLAELLRPTDSSYRSEWDVPSRPETPGQIGQDEPTLPSSTYILPGSPIGQIVNPMPEDVAGVDAYLGPQPGSIAADVRDQTARRLSAPVSLLDAPEQMGQDTFADMQNAVRFAEEFTETVVPQLRARLVEQQAAKQRVRDAAEAKKALRRRLAQDPRLQDAVLSADDRAAIEAEIRREFAVEAVADTMMTPVTSFAGGKDSVLNKQIRLAEELLAEGKFYLAADRYDVAHTVDPDNPLPLLGKGHALIGAGEYRTAVIALLQGIERFPDIARFQLDLRELLGADQLLDVRRADLENRLKDREDYELRFLLGYIEYYSGMPDFGLEHLAKAAADAPPESVIRRFVQLVREQPTPAADTQPAL
ncbi:MAG TPA: hypothetical protein VMZ31_03005 [Phycisphaerae bacterium]|nr:hypothetical protein [Phycisphaerae bacterium]